MLKGRYPLTDADAKIISRLPGSRRVVAAPRGHAKSTNLTFKGTAHAVLYQYKHYPIIISDSSEQSEGFLESIRVELEDNAAIREDFGELAGPVWRSNVLVTKTNIKIEAIGSGKKIRGRKHRNWRPDLIILDDVENDENVRTPEQRRKLRDWFNKAVSKAGDDYTDIVYIGTLLHYDSLLANTLRNPAYQAIKYKAVIRWSKADSLWREWEALYTDLNDPDRAAHALSYLRRGEPRCSPEQRSCGRPSYRITTSCASASQRARARLTVSSKMSRSTRTTASLWRSGSTITTRPRSILAAATLRFLDLSILAR